MYGSISGETCLLIHYHIIGKHMVVCYKVTEDRSNGIVDVVGVGIDYAFGRSGVPFEFLDQRQIAVTN